MFAMIQLYAEAKLSSMDKMWLSFVGIGLMVLAALIVTFARNKTKGWIKVVLTLVAIVMLLYGIGFGFISIF